MSIDHINAKRLMTRFREDPVFFGEKVFGGEKAWAKQCEIMMAVRDFPRVAVPSGFAVGKTWTAARIALWFLYCHPRSLVITTAPTWRQVEHVLWAEIRRQHKCARVPLGGDLLRTQIKIDDDWFALGLSTDEPTRFQGFHSEHLLLIFDEAAGVDRGVWDVAEGQMTGQHARWLAIGNPVDPSGPFYDSCKNEFWRTIPISCLDSPNVKGRNLAYPRLVTASWVEDRKREWGESSPIYQSRVLGQFPEESEHGLVPLAWVLAANERAIRKPKDAAQPAKRKVGVDVARSGADTTVFLLREGNRVGAIEEYHGLSTMESTGRLIRFVELHSLAWEDVNIDLIGIGAGVYDRLVELKKYAHGVNFGAGASDSERYANMRAECYWRVREAMRPDGESPLGIPAQHGRLCSELVSIHWSVTSTGKILIEPKEDIKERVGRSPDHADALALTFFEDSSCPLRLYTLDSTGGGKRKPWCRPDNEAIWTRL